MKLKSILFSFFMLSLLFLTSCGGKETPIVEQCPTCKGEKICQMCQGKAVCASCQGSGQCDVCKGDKKCRQCKGTGEERAKCSKCKGYGFAPPANPGDEPVPCKACKATGLDQNGKKAPCPHCAKLTDEFKKRVEAKKIDLKKYEADVKGSNFPAVAEALKGIKKGSGECGACKGSGSCTTCNGDKKCIICKGTAECQPCEGHGHKIDFVKCPKCYEQLPYGTEKCTKCQAELTYENLQKKSAEAK